MQAVATEKTTTEVIETKPLTQQAGRDLWELADVCSVQTAELLHDVQAASVNQIKQALDTVRAEHAAHRPAEMLEALARVLGHDEEHLSRAILDLGNKMSASLMPSVPMVPFGGKLIAPSAFYESYEQMHQLGRVLLAPVLYAEDTDAMGVGSINPVAASLLAQEVESAVHKRFGIHPFVTVARLDYESWTFLTRKHFEL